MATGQGSPCDQYFSLISRPCLPGEIQCVTIVNADPISPKVSPLLIGILQDDQTTCADVTAAVFLVPTGRGKLEHIDHVPSVNIFGDRSARNSDGLKRLV